LQILTYPSVFVYYFIPSLRVIPLEFPQELQYQKTKSPWVIVQHCSYNDMSSQFDGTPACDRQTDRHWETDTHRTV